MNDLVAHLDSSLTLGSGRKSVCVVRAGVKEAPSLCCLWDDSADEKLCNHVYTHKFLKGWLENIKTDDDSLCPYCSRAPKQREKSLCTLEVVPNRGSAARYTPLGARVRTDEYRPGIILNQEKLFLALVNGKEVAPIIPEFYNDNCPLGSDAAGDEPLSLMLEDGALGFGNVFKLVVRDESLREKMNMCVVVKAISIAATKIRDTVHREAVGEGWLAQSAYVAGDYMIDVMASSLASNIAMRATDPCVNFPTVFGFFACDSDDDPSDRKGYILMEALDGTIESSNTVHRRGLIGLSDKGMEISAEVLRSIAFQIVFALANIAERYGMVHHDCVPRNVMVKLLAADDADDAERYTWHGHNMTDRAKPFVYTIGTTDFVISNAGVLAKLIDFGIATSYKDPVVINEITFAMPRRHLRGRLFSVESKDFRVGFDVSYFIASFVNVTCFAAVEIRKEMALMEENLGHNAEASSHEREAQHIVTLANDLLFELLRQRGPVTLKRRREGERKKRETYEDTTRRRLRNARTIEQGWAIAIEGGSSFQTGGEPIPGEPMYERVNPIDFLMNADAFERYRRRPTEAENLRGRIPAGKLCGTPIRKAAFPEIF